MVLEFSFQFFLCVYSLPSFLPTHFSLKSTKPFDENTVRFCQFLCIPIIQQFQYPEIPINTRSSSDFFFSSKWCFLKKNVWIKKQTIFKNFILIGIFFLYLHQFCEFWEEKLVFPQFKQYVMYHCVR